MKSQDQAEKEVKVSKPKSVFLGNTFDLIFSTLGRSETRQRRPLSPHPHPPQPQLKAGGLSTHYMGFLRGLGYSIPPFREVPAGSKGSNHRNQRAFRCVFPQTLPQPPPSWWGCPTLKVSEKSPSSMPHPMLALQLPSLGNGRLESFHFGLDCIHPLQHLFLRWWKR